jgi:hypothetical protein
MNRAPQDNKRPELTEVIILVFYEVYNELGHQSAFATIRVVTSS